MKKGWKIFWIVCGVTFISGFVCCIISLSLGVTTEAISKHFPKGYIGWEWDDDWDDDDDDFLHRHDGADRRDFGTDAVESYSGVREVELEMAVGNVTVEHHDGDTIEVETVGVAEELKFHSYYEISCGAGEIVIGEEVYCGIKPEEKINNNAQKLINIECNVGDITVDFTGA